MSNLLALMAHCERGEEYIVGQQAHTYKYEGGGAAVLGSIQPQPLEVQADGSLDLNQVLEAIKPDDFHFARTRLLALEVVHDRTIASIFGRPSHAPLLHVRRLRLGNGTPMSRELAWYDLTLAPRLEDWCGEGSAYAWLREHCGIHMGEAEQSIEAIMSTPAEMEAFGFDTPMPCLLIKRRSQDVEGRMVEYVEGTFRGDAYAYRVRLAG